MAITRVDRTEAGTPLFVHECNGLVRHTVLPLGDDGWNWTADGGLMPSVHCESCGTHGWWYGATDTNPARWRSV